MKGVNQSSVSALFHWYLVTDTLKRGGFVRRHQGWVSFNLKTYSNKRPRSNPGPVTYIVGIAQDAYLRATSFATGPLGLRVRENST